jgi:hypothetical protein
MSVTIKRVVEHISSQSHGRGMETGDNNGDTVSLPRVSKSQRLHWPGPFMGGPGPCIYVFRCQQDERVIRVFGEKVIPDKRWMQASAMLDASMTLILLDCSLIHFHPVRARLVLPGLIIMMTMAT